MEEQQQIELADGEGAKWYTRAQMALEKGEDDLAHEALTRRKQQLELSDSLKEQVEGQQASITSLYESMKVACAPSRRGAPAALGAARRPAPTRAHAPGRRSSRRR